MPVVDADVEVEVEVEAEDGSARERERERARDTTTLQKGPRLVPVSDDPHPRALLLPSPTTLSNGFL
jgi:hypothetical protein